MVVFMSRYKQNDVLPCFNNETIKSVMEIELIPKEYKIHKTNI